MKNTIPKGTTVEIVIDGEPVMHKGKPVTGKVDADYGGDFVTVRWPWGLLATTPRNLLRRARFDVSQLQIGDIFTWRGRGGSLYKAVVQRSVEDYTAFDIVRVERPTASYLIYKEASDDDQSG